MSKKIQSINERYNKARAIVLFKELIYSNFQIFCQINLSNILYRLY